MRIVVISDVHLGYHDSDAAAFSQFLDAQLSDRPDQVILLGDIFDFWRRSDADLLLENQGVVEKLFQLPIVFVRGNHDFSMAKLFHRYPQLSVFNVETKVTLRNQKSTFYLCHGYELEVFTSMETIGIDAYEAFAEAMCHAGETGGAAASFLWSIYEKLSRGYLTDKRELLKAVGDTPAEARTTLQKVDAFAKSAVRSIPLGLKPSDVLIFGHTHRPFINGRTVNTGSWIVDENKQEHTYAEITDNAFNLRTWPVSRTQRKAVYAPQQVTLPKQLPSRAIDEILIRF
ncbi:MAG: UDP-2,3-diacylglucosamine diphosphatase [Candidatus Bathyarchaeia archaeon]